LGTVKKKKPFFPTHHPSTISNYLHDFFFQRTEARIFLEQGGQIKNAHKMQKEGTHQGGPKAQITSFGKVRFNQKIWDTVYTLRIFLFLPE